MRAARISFNARKLDQAYRLIRLCKSAYQNLYENEERIEFAIICFFEGRILFQQSKNWDCEASLRRALEIFEKEKNPSQFITEYGDCLFLLTCLYLKMDSLDKFKQYFSICILFFQTYQQKEGPGLMRLLKHRFGIIIQTKELPLFEFNFELSTIMVGKGLLSSLFAFQTPDFLFFP